MKTWSREQIQSQLEIFPESQICIEVDGQLIGSSSSLILDFDLYEDNNNWLDRRTDLYDIVWKDKNN